MSEERIIQNHQQLLDVLPAIAEHGYPLRLTWKTSTRSLSQNALFHKWCEEVASFFVDHGKTHFASGATISKESIKRNLKQTFLGTHKVEHIDLTTGEVTEREELRHTSDLDKGEMQHFLDQVSAWATEYGIGLTRPEDSEYLRIAREMDS